MLCTFGTQVPTDLWESCAIIVGQVINGYWLFSHFLIARGCSYVPPLLWSIMLLFSKRFIELCKKANVTTSGLCNNASFVHWSLLQVWDEGLAQQAQEYAEACFFNNNPIMNIPDGSSFNTVQDNIGATNTEGEGYLDIIQSWYNQGDSYDHDTLVCSISLTGCDSYRQVIFISHSVVTVVCEVCRIRHACSIWGMHLAKCMHFGTLGGKVHFFIKPSWAFI